ncbi:dihydroneopterin aldolase [Lysinibacter sp. HNR]|uniref:dihydroneopterin aldolase n=1 Tax=Lysinibacter sp. HNR TaxID=3031408 RepID=UPI002434E41E|nr:dihydroneopterin aldolase [Lysinibacter sp. HNR]WGD36812.1 dihydroneopterin aldolase [Lysinibacter sp. HNR]
MNQFFKGDVITLTGLECFAYHGVFEGERETGQRFVVDVEMDVDLRASARSDDLSQTVNYADLAPAVVAAVESNPVDLIETVAERVAEIVLSYSGVRAVRVVLHKPDAPISVSFADVSVTVVRP